MMSDKASCSPTSIPLNEPIPESAPDSSGAFIFNSSIPSVVFFSFSASLFAVARLSVASSNPNNSFTFTLDPDTPPQSNPSNPNRFTINCANLCNAITSPFIYGKTFATIGKNMLPIVLARFSKLAFNNLNWLAG